MSLRLALKRSLMEEESNSSSSTTPTPTNATTLMTSVQQQHHHLKNKNNEAQHRSTTNNNKKKKKRKKQNISSSTQENNNLKSTKTSNKKTKNDDNAVKKNVATLPKTSTNIATATLPLSSSLVSSSFCQQQSYNKNNFNHNNNQQHYLVKIPPQPKQKYPIGTFISKDFIDPETNKSRTYEATIERYEYVLQKKKWMYYVYYEDGEGEHLTESAIKKHIKKEKRNNQTTRKLENDPVKLFVQYFGGLLTKCNERNDHPRNKKNIPTTINWNAFLEDLNRVPDLASTNDYQTITGQRQHNTSCCCGAYPLQYALLHCNVPTAVIEKLIECNWEAVGFTDCQFGYDTLSWMICYNNFIGLDPKDVNPDIVELVLRESYENIPEFYFNRLLTQAFINDDDDDERTANTTSLNGCTTIDYMIDQVGLVKPSIIEVMFKYSPPAVAWVLIRHFKSEKIVSSHILTLALKAGCDFERYFGGSNNDTTTTTSTTTFFDENWFDVDSDYTSVWNDIVLGLDGSDQDNVALFHTYVKAMSKSILQKRDVDDDSVLRKNDRETVVVDEDFYICLPSCVLYCLSEWETNLDHLWNTFAEKCPTEFLRGFSSQGMVNNPLHAAIRLGFQYDPVIRSLVEANFNDDDDDNDECLLDCLDSVDYLPPVLLAAATTPPSAAAAANNHSSSFLRESNLMGTSYLSESQYLDLNQINNTYNLLLANPSIVKTALIDEDEEQDPHAATSTIGIASNQEWDENFDYF